MMDSDTRLKQIEAMLASNPEDDFLIYAAALEYQKRNQKVLLDQKLKLRLECKIFKQEKLLLL